MIVDTTTLFECITDAEELGLDCLEDAHHLCLDLRKANVKLTNGAKPEQFFEATANAAKSLLDSTARFHYEAMDGIEEIIELASANDLSPIQFDGLTHMNSLSAAGVITENLKRRYVENMTWQCPDSGEDLQFTYLEKFGGCREIAFMAKAFTPAFYSTVSDQLRQEAIVARRWVVDGRPLPARFQGKVAEEPEQPTAAEAGTQDAQSDRVAAKRMSLDAANAKAIKLAKADPDFVHRTKREWADAIGCSASLVSKMTFWMKTMEASGRGKAASSRPKAVSLTGPLEATMAGEPDVELQRLMTQSEADNTSDPSPVESDPPGLGHRVYQPKQL